MVLTFVLRLDDPVKPWPPFGRPSGMNYISVL